MSRRPPFALCIAGLVAACNVGPDYHPPKTALPTSFSETTGNVPVAARADLSKWWTVFQDPELNSLVARAIEANLDLAAAASRVRMAREQEIIAGASEWPSVNANGVGANLHSGSSPLSQIGSAGMGGPPSSSPTNLKLYSLGFDATWEIDLFGGTRRAVESAEANTEAAIWQLHDAEVTLTAEVASDYLDLRAAQQRLALLQDELNDQRQLLGLVEARARTGFVTQLDVNQQNVLVNNAAAQIPAMDAEKRALEHALAVLLAVTPESVDSELEQTKPIPSFSVALPSSLPSDLLRRRPDIRSAERKLAAATADEGVAVAQLYPRFELIGAASFTADKLSNLLSSNNFGTVGVGSVIWPLFEGGKLHANIRATKEAELQALFAYRKTVLGALQETEDALSRVNDDQRNVTALSETERAAASSENLARAQYAHGTVPFNSVLTAEMAGFSARDQLVQGRVGFARDFGALYKALGGGWDEASVVWQLRPKDSENE